jgi:hypothetical protein
MRAAGIGPRVLVERVFVDNEVWDISIRPIRIYCLITPRSSAGVLELSLPF